RRPGPPAMAAPHPLERPALFGLLAEFENPSALVAAARAAREAGYRSMDAYSPFPIHELTHALALPKTKLPLIVLGGGVAGCGSALLMMWFSPLVHLPLNVARQPLPTR